MIQKYVAILNLEYFNNVYDSSEKVIAFFEIGVFEGLNVCWFADNLSKNSK